GCHDTIHVRPRVRHLTSSAMLASTDTFAPREVMLIAAGPAPRSSRSRSNTSRSMRANSSGVSSPSSRRIWASISRSRSTVPSRSSSSATARNLSSTNPSPSMRSESRRNIWFGALCGLQLQANVDEVVRWPGPRVLERQVVVPAGDVLDLAVERAFLIPRDQKRRVHDHLIPDRLVDTGRDRHIAELSQDARHVALGSSLQGRVAESSVLHAPEVRGALLGRDLLLQAADVLVFRLDLANRLIRVPQHLQSELELVLHFSQHVAERVKRRAEQLDDVLVGSEDRAER